MPKRRTWLFAFPFLFSLLLVGCIGIRQQVLGPPPRFPVQKTEKVVYVVQKDAGIVVKDAPYRYSYRGISFQGESIKETDVKGYDGIPYKQYSFVFEGNGSSLLASCDRTMHLRSTQLNFRTLLRYYVDVSVQDNANGYVMTLTPRERDIYYDDYRMEPAKYTEEELLDRLSKGFVELKMELDSTYDKDSFYANFKRVFIDLEVLGVKGDVNTKKGIFILGIGSTSAELTVEIRPYEGGSKAVVIAKINLYPTSTEAGTRTVDVKKIVDDAKREIESVVKN